MARRKSADKRKDRLPQWMRRRQQGTARRRVQLVVPATLLRKRSPKCLQDGAKEAIAS